MIIKLIYYNNKKNFLYTPLNFVRFYPGNVSKGPASKFSDNTTEIECR